MTLAQIGVPGTRYIEQHGVAGIGRSPDGAWDIAFSGIVDIRESGERYGFCASLDPQDPATVDIRLQRAGEGPAWYPLVAFSPAAVMVGTNSDMKNLFWPSRDRPLEDWWDQRYFQENNINANAKEECVREGVRVVRVRTPSAFAAHCFGEERSWLAVRKAGLPMTQPYGSAGLAGTVRCTPVYRRTTAQLEDFARTTWVRKPDPGIAAVALDASSFEALFRYFAAAYQKPFRCTEVKVRRVRVPQAIAAVAVRLSPEGAEAAVYQNGAVSSLSLADLRAPEEPEAPRSRRRGPCQPQWEHLRGIPSELPVRGA